jgi:hypothetical protein
MARIGRPQQRQLGSNVPAVLVLRPFVEVLPNPDRAWLNLAMASTLAGNFTVLDSIANLIVVHNAASRGVRIGFLGVVCRGRSSDRADYSRRHVLVIIYAELIEPGEETNNAVDVQCT